ncbi:MAG: hexokinase [Spirochaetaceae bacterium]|jgi:hexokinase|nr:hexokinase [Spirochaetaceae bacterium]
MAINTAVLDDFARYYGFHYACIDAESLVQDFCVDMERGLRGDSSSLPMIPSHLSPISVVPPNKTVVALDAGGTNLRVSRIRFDEHGRPVPFITERAPMPGTQGRLSAAEFFDELAHAAAPCFSGAEAITGMGFCFSYEMEVTKDGDGIPGAMSKEVDVPELTGRSLGAGLREALAKRGISAPEHIVFLNDTTATLLAGVTQIPVRPADKTRDSGEMAPDKIGVEAGELMGFILGTGVNTAYMERSIPKINFNSCERPQIVVAESGAWAQRWQGLLDREFDAATTIPGFHILEKAVAGAYLGGLVLLIYKRAIHEKLLCWAGQEALLQMSHLETRDLNEFLHRPLALEGVLGSLFSPADRDTVAAAVYLASLVTERAALLSAGLIAGTVEHVGAGFNPLSPFRIAVEGTTFMRYHHLRESLEGHLHRLLCRKAPRFYRIAPVEHASLFGAAVAALA